MLELRKKGNKHWLLIDEEIGEFTPSKFTINRLNNVINIVYFNNLKSKEYNVSDCYIFDIDDTSGFNTSNGVAFMDKLEELNCPCFQKDVNNFYISGGSWSELTNFDALNDATLPLSGAEQIPIIQGGETKKVAVSEFQTDVSGKLDKVSTAGVERAYIINADGSQGTKATIDFKDVLEFPDLASFPATGETSKIYLALDTNKTYRWSGSAYVQLSGGIDFPSDGKTYGVKDGLAVDLGVNIFKDFPNYIIIQEQGGGLNYIGTSVLNSTGTQSSLLYGSGGLSWRKWLSAGTAGSSSQFNESNYARIRTTDGFYYRLRIKAEDASTITDVRTSFGFAGTAGIFNTNPSAAIQGLLSLAADNTDTTLQIMYKDTVTGIHKIDLGASFPKDSTSEYIVEFLRFKNTTTIFYKITNVTTGAVAQSSFVSSLFALTPCLWRNNAATASACAFVMRRLELYVQD